MENSRSITEMFLDLVRLPLNELPRRSVLTTVVAESGWTPDQTDMYVTHEFCHPHGY